MIDDGERRRARVIELVERDGDETPEHRICERLCRERANDRFERSPVAQRAVGELLRERAAAAGGAVCGRRDRGERRAERVAAEHAVHGERGLALGFLHALRMRASARRQGALSRDALCGRRREAARDERVDDHHLHFGPLPITAIARAS